MQGKEEQREQGTGSNQDSGAASAGRMSSRAVLASVLIGILCSVVIWIITPYNDLVFNSPYVSDSYLPVAGLFVMLVVVLLVNPLLRRLLPRVSLSSRQLALIFGIILVASVVPGQGLMRILPPAIAKLPTVVSQSLPISSAYEAAKLPPYLFPEVLGFGKMVPASEYYMLELPKGENIPWSNWVPPLLSWGAFLIVSWMMVLGVSLIVFPQWRRAERLPFPLLTVERALIGDADEGHAFAGIFRTRAFWIAAGAVFLLHLVAGAKVYNPTAVPAIPLNFSLDSLFREEPFIHLPWWIYANRIYFTFVGAAFFMPNRTAFSIWFFVIAYAVYEMSGKAYFPPFHDEAIADHRMGAMVVVAAVVVWLGRAQWAHVFRCLVTKPRCDEDRRDRLAAGMFTCGCVGMFLWMLWIGVEWYWALFFVAFAFMAVLLIARIVAETGFPFVRIDVGGSMVFMKTFPVSCYGPVSLWFSQVVIAMFTFASRVSLAAMATHALGLDEKVTARQQMRMAYLFLLVLVLGVLVAGGATLYADYHYTTSLDGRNVPLSRGGSELFDGISGDLVRHKATLDRGSTEALMNPTYGKLGHTGFGAALAAALSWACLLFPKWPLHPIGLLIVGSIYAKLAWFSVFVGWMAKILLVRYGGSRLYRTARPFFLGLIVGEVLAAVLWFLVPAAIILLGGHTYFRVDVVPQ